MRRRRPGLRGVLAASGAALLTLTACTGVPGSSAPEPIETLPVDAGGASAATVIVPPNADPRDIVSLFQENNVTGDAARVFLSPLARNRWQDQSATIIQDARVSNVGPHDTVTVSGNEIGSLDADGEYTPALQGDGTGTGGNPVARTYSLVKVKGQWRINTLQNGLLLTNAQFSSLQQYTLYFYDVTEKRLIPDVRRSFATTVEDRLQWLVSELAAGPRDALQDAETNEFPAQTEPKSVVVSLNKQTAHGTVPLSIEIPGSSQLSAANRDRLATEIAATVSSVAPEPDMQITDGGAPVDIPAARSTVFSLAVLGDPIAASEPVSQLYYLNGARVVVGADGRPLPGRLDNYSFTSVALADRRSPFGLYAAGIRDNGSTPYLDVGTQRGGMSVVKFPKSIPAGPLSRPDWAPGLAEVWLGDGTDIVRVSLTGHVTVVPVQAAGGKAPGRVVALRLSPDGTRVALVLANGITSQIWIGTVVRPTTGQVRVENLQPISPPDVSIQDVGWNGPVAVFAIGKDLQTNVPDLFGVNVDGSLWEVHSDVDELPQPLETLAIAQDELPIVSTPPTLWQQAGNSWSGLGRDETIGSSPVYSN